MKRAPVCFVGHGSPMNAIEDNAYTAQWKTLGEKRVKPDAIISISAHWFTSGTKIMDSQEPKTIHDMYGFPEELYQVQYNAPGSPGYAHLSQSLISRYTEIDNTWGLDHGTWSVLRRIYPEADIPVFQLSVDMHADAADYFQIGRDLRALREQGVLIFGSGNVVHNLARLNWDMEKGYPWADEFDNYIKSNVLNKNYENVIDYEKAGASSSMAFTTIEHYAPLLFVLGATDENDSVSVFNDRCDLGSLSMTSYLFQ